MVNTHTGAIRSNELDVYMAIIIGLTTAYTVEKERGK